MATVWWVISEAKRARRRRAMWRRIDRGLCRECAQQSAPGSRLCWEHMQRHADRMRIARRAAGPVERTPQVVAYLDFKRRWSKAAWRLRRLRRALASRLRA